MRIRSRIALAILLLAVVGGIAWLALRPNEPMYKGRRLSVWLEGFAGGNTNISRFEADQAVRHIGTNAIPTLMRLIHANDSPLMLKIVALARKQHVVKVTHTPARVYHMEAEWGFFALEANARVAVPELIAMYEKNDSLEDRTSATFALGYIGPAAGEAAPALVRGLGDADAKSRAFAAYALGRIHTRPDLVVPALVACMNDKNALVRMHATGALGPFGADARAAVPALLNALADSDQDVRQAAKDALKQIDPEALEH